MRKTNENKQNNSTKNCGRGNCGKTNESKNVKNYGKSSGKEKDCK